jgi:hypothetical protein
MCFLHVFMVHEYLFAKQVIHKTKQLYQLIIHFKLPFWLLIFCIKNEPSLFYSKQLVIIARAIQSIV